VLLLPQNKTEDILEERLKVLGIKVQRPYKAIGIKGDIDELGSIEVLFESGEVIKAQYVIGADGARSTVSTISWLVVPFHILTIAISFPDPPAFWYRVCRPRRSTR